MECSSPPPTGPEYYNQSVILRNKRSQYDAVTGAVVLVPPSAAVRIKPTPPPKPKRPTKDDTGTHIIDQEIFAVKKFSPVA